MHGLRDGWYPDSVATPVPLHLRADRLRPGAYHFKRFSRLSKFDCYMTYKGVRSFYLDR